MGYVELPDARTLQESRCRCLDEARKLFEQFHRFASPESRRARCQRLIPPVLVHVGELRGLIYRSDRGTCRSPRTFIHFMRTPARLACDPQGRQLYVLGGRYRVTPRGIEG